MKTSDLLLTIIIILIFVGLYFINVLGVGIQNLKDNWPLYRCNPVIMPFAGLFGEDVGKNFNYCIQNIQTGYMSELLQPIHYNMSVMGDIGKDITQAIQYVRAFFYKLTTFVTNIIKDIMGVFLNILIQVQKLTINIKDLFAKLIGTLTSLLYILSGSLMTMKATWAGPPGQLVRSVCFHPDTLVKKEDGKIVKMKNVCIGDKLKNGQTVYCTMNIHNLDENKNHIETLYNFKNGEKDKDILVSGSHLIFNKSINNFIPVKEHPDSVESSINSNSLSCLITSNHTIPLGNYIFHDWEDNNDILD